MPDQLRLDDLSPFAIAQLLASPDFLLAPEEEAAVHDFVDRIGGIDNAWLAVEMLANLKAA